MGTRSPKASLPCSNALAHSIVATRIPKPHHPGTILPDPHPDPEPEPATYHMTPDLVNYGSAIWNLGGGRGPWWCAESRSGGGSTRCPRAGGWYTGSAPFPWHHLGEATVDALRAPYQREVLTMPPRAIEQPSSSLSRLGQRGVVSDKVQDSQIITEK